MRIKGTIQMYIFSTDDDGVRIHTSREDAEDDLQSLAEAGANGLTSVEDVELNLEHFEIKESE